MFDKVESYKKTLLKELLILDGLEEERTLVVEGKSWLVVSWKKLLYWRR